MRILPALIVVAVLAGAAPGFAQTSSPDGGGALTGALRAPILYGSDADTECAAVFAMLSDDTGGGPQADRFTALSEMAGNAYLRQRPGEDADRYSLQILTRAQQLEAALADGRLNSVAVQTTTADCYARYAVRPGG